MARPTRYFVEYQSGDMPDTAWPVVEDAATLRQAKQIARWRKGQVYQRVDLRDVTPPSDPPGLLWEWDERPVD